MKPYKVVIAVGVIILYVVWPLTGWWPIFILGWGLVLGATIASGPPTNPTPKDEDGS